MIANVKGVTKLFDTHFSDGDNKRIVFSGRFGSGKSYFLKKYFKSKKHKTFWVSPLNYVVNQNEDIFEYIKFDILRQVINHLELKNTEDQKVSEELYVNAYLNEKPSEILDTLVSLIVSGLPPLKGIYGEIKSSIKKYENYKDSLKDEDIKHFDTVKSYLDSFFHIRGGIYEDDIITQIIRSLIGKLNGNYKTVLVIDDLDRLDPEHIFRILNILSVHNFNYDSENKFNFSKVIVVCDIDNIKSSFRHKYGIGVDFEGYIGKFYSNDIFRFNNDISVKFFCDNHISPLLKDDNCSLLMQLILTALVDSKKITIRNLIKSKPFTRKHYFSDFNLTEDSINITRPFGEQNMLTYNGVHDIIDKKTKNFFINLSDLPILRLVKLASVMCGDFKIFREYMSELCKDQSQKRNYPNIKNNFKIINALFLIRKISSNFYKENGVYKYFNSDLDVVPSVDTLTNPQTDVFGLLVDINLKWNNVNKYDGSESFYKDCKIKYNYHSEEKLRKPIIIQDIFKEILDVVDFLEINDIQYKLGLTGK